jgi:hypothetical protein
MPVAAVEIPKHYVPTFGRNVMWTPQQNKSRLRPYVTTDTAVGEGVAPWDIWGETEAEEATGRYDDTPIMEVERDRPWVFPKGYHWGTLIDQLDKLKQVLDPTSPMIQAARKALDRKLDRAIIMPAFFGPRWTGKDIATATSAGPVNFDTTKYQVANTVGSAGGATPVGMNVAKLKAARKILLANEAVEGENADEPVYVAITAEQWSDLVNETQATNRDWIDTNAIATGKIPGLLGFEFVHIEQLPSAGTSPNDRYCPVWVKSAIGLIDWQGVVINMAPDPGKQYRVRPYAKFFAGATRTMDGKVIQIVCREP